MNHFTLSVVFMTHTVDRPRAALASVSWRDKLQFPSGSLNNCLSPLKLSWVTVGKLSWMGFGCIKVDYYYFLSLWQQTFCLASSRQRAVIGTRMSGDWVGKFCSLGFDLPLRPFLNVMGSIHYRQNLEKEGRNKYSSPFRFFNEKKEVQEQ